MPQVSPMNWWALSLTLMVLAKIITLLLPLSSENNPINNKKHLVTSIKWSW